MNKKLFTNVNKLPMDNPSIKLMEKHFMTTKKNSRKHIFNYRISTDASLLQGI